MRRRFRPSRPRPEAIRAQGEFVAAAFGQHHRAERDANDGELVALALQLGARFVRSPPLEGWLWVPRHGSWRPLEIKRPEVEGFQHEYTPQQRRFLTWCRERAAPVLVWRCRDDVLRDLGAA